MAFARLAAIPFDHVRAELAAFPLASESALRLHPISLDPTLEGVTGTLWRDAERALLGSFPAFSVDECVAWRDRLWFQDQPIRAIPLAHYLRCLVEQCLRVDGATAVPHWNHAGAHDGLDPGVHAALARRTFLWLSFALPPDLLLAATGNALQTPERIEALSPLLARMLEDNGYAETHLHVSVALDFPLAWVGALHAAGRDDFLADAFKAPGADLDEGNRLAPWLVRAGIVRFVLAMYLARRQPQELLDQFLTTGFWRHVVRQLNLSAFPALMDLLAQTASGRLTNRITFATAKYLYKVLARIQPGSLPNLPQEVMARDPIANLAAPGGPDLSSPEVRLVRAALAYLTPPRSCVTRDRLFAQLFWQYLRVRNLLYRHVVQRPMTPGLQWFIRFFDRSKPIRKGVLSPTLTLHSAAAIGGAKRGLRALEVRTGPYSDPDQLFSYIEQVQKVASTYRAAEGHPGLEWGVIFHFPKVRAGGASEGRPAAHWRGGNGDPRCDPATRSGNPAGYRFSRFYLTRLEEAMALEWLLRSLPRSLEIVRGVDVCTDELGVPNWVLAPLVERVRRAAADGSAALRQASGIHLPRFRTTVHAGEDFVHLLTGLRQVDEAIEAYHLMEGDRIGHGLALGVDPETWARRACSVPLPREERLFDLAWEWTRYARQLCPVDAGRRGFLERQIALLSQSIFQRTLTPFEVDQLCRDLRDVFRLWLVGFPDRSPVGSLAQARSRNTRLGLLYQFLSCPEVFGRGRETVLVETGTEAVALQHLQRSIRAQVGAMGLTVEVNPTSNLLIGDLGDLTTHPFWRMRPPRGGGDSPPVPICIGSDDPLVFASNLRLEYQWIYDALVLAGLSSDEATGWMTQVRNAGLVSRFTLAHTSGSDLKWPFNAARPSEAMLI